MVRVTHSPFSVSPTEGHKGQMSGVQESIAVELFLHGQLQLASRGRPARLSYLLMFNDSPVQMCAEVHSVLRDGTQGEENMSPAHQEFTAWWSQPKHYMAACPLG